MKLWIKNIEKNMYSNFDYIKVDSQYYFSLKCVQLVIFARLLEIKKKIVEEVKCRF